MLKIENTNRFIKEFKYYQQSIDQITNPIAKERAKKLLTNLEMECRYITEAHNPANSKSIDPRTAKDSIEKSVNLRRQLSALIKDSKGY